MTVSPSPQRRTSSEEAALLSLSKDAAVLRSLAKFTGNVFANVAHRLAEEQIVELLSARNVRIERIVSTGHATPPDEWYDQDRAEWVLLVAGAAGLIFEGEAEPLRLEPGSYVHIEAHIRHRVAWTDPSMPTIWVAIHYQ